MVQRRFAGAVWLLSFIIFAVVAACGGGNAGSGGNGAAAAPPSFTVGGTVSGLAGTGLVLQDNNGGNLTITANGAFTFNTSVANGANYKVTVLTQPTGPTQTCTVNSGTGTINGAKITSVSVVCSASAYTIGGTVSGLTGTGLMLQDNGGDNLAIAANGTFTFSTPVANGANYAVTVYARPNGPLQICTVTGGTGAVAGANISSVTVNCVIPQPRYAFVSNYGDNTVSSYEVNGANGSLKYISKAQTGIQPLSVTADPTGQYVYVANMGNPCAGGTVSQYTVGNDGSLTPMAASSVMAGNNPMFITMDPSGKHVYVANQCSNTISQYTIGAGGSLIPLSTPTAPTGLSPNAITIDSAGKYAYVANMGGTVSQYTIAADGSFTPMATASVAAGGTPVSVSVDLASKYAYVVNFGSNTVSQYTIGAGGGLTPMAASTVAAGAAPQAITVDQSGKYAYVANYNYTGTLTQFTIGAGGGLVPMAASSVAAVSYPRDVIVDPSGKYAYATNASNGLTSTNCISQYAIGSNGSLTPLTPATAPAQPLPYSIAMTSGSAAVQALPKYAYVANKTSNDISEYTIDTVGRLTPMAASSVAAGSQPELVTVDPTGKYAYVANGVSNDVSVYSIDATGALTQVSCGAVGTPGCTGAAVPTNFAAGTGPFSVTIDPSDRYAYVVNQGSNDISAYAINSTTGVLTRINCAVPLTCSSAIPANFPAGTSPQSVTIDPSGQYVYVANKSGNTVSQYTIDVKAATQGSLIPMAASAVAAGAGPHAVVVDPSGKYAYVANGTDNTVSQYTIGASGGLAPMAASAVAAGTTPKSVTIDPAGKHAFVANSGDTTVSQYTIGAGGNLTPMAASGVATGGNPTSVTVDPSGTYAYVTNSGSANVSQYIIGAGGNLTPMTTATTGAGTTPTSVVTTGTRK